MRKFLAALLLAFPVWASEQITVNQFGYLNNNENSLIIQPTESQDLLNVDVTPGGKSIKRRMGYGTYKTLSSGLAMHGGHHFFDATGNDVQVWGSSTSLYGIVADATPTTLISSASLSATWDCADTLGFAYCLNSGRDALVRTNGATVTWFSAQKGTMVEATPERLAIAGVSGTLNTIYFSESGVFTNFTTGLLDTSPFTAVISAPGSRVTHIRWGCGKLLWWKDQSFGYLTGDTQFNVENTIVSDNIGTIDNSSTMDPGGSIWFRGQEGHIYTYDCSFLEKKSIEIGPNVQASGNRTSNSYTETSQSDFQAGQIVRTDYLTTTHTPGSVLLSTSFALITSPGFEDGPDNTANVITNWTVSASGPVIKACTGCINICGSTITAYTGSYYGTTATEAGQNNSVRVDLLDSGGGIIQTATMQPVDQCGWTQNYIVNSSTVGHSVRVRIRMAGTTSRTATSNQFTWPGALSFYYQSDTDGLGTTYTFDNFITAPSTGVYYSSVHNAPNLTAWDVFTADTVANGGTQAFFMRSSTNPFTILSSTPTWTAQTAGNVVTIATGTYFQVRDDFTIDAATETPRLSEFTVNWFEGQAADKAYSIYFADAVWWSVAFGEGQSSNNYIFKYDLINPGWTLYNFGAGGFLIQNNRLYFGSTASNGIVYRFGESNSDSGSSISSYWKSKDFTGADPWLENQFKQIDTYWARKINQTATFTYGINTTTTTTSYTVNLSSATQAIIRNKKLLPSGKTGDLFNFKVSDDSTNSPWEFFGMRTVFDVLPYRPSQ